MSSILKSYFWNKKTDVSDNSNDGDERQKSKEGSLDLSLNQDDAVFPEGIASILYDCLKNLDQNVNEIHLLSTTTNDA